MLFRSSFEPLPDAFQALQRKAAGDGQWECRNVALGDNAGNARINVSANSYSSSLLPVTDTALRLEPAIGYVGSENIVIERLDDIFDEIVNANDVPYLKVDTQGYELNVLRGGLRVLARFPLIQLETSFFSVYEGQVLVGDVIKFLDEIGYRIVSLEPGWNDPKTGELLEADLIFARK